MDFNIIVMMKNILDMKDFGKMIKNLVMEQCFIKMGQFILAIGIMI